MGALGGVRDQLVGDLGVKLRFATSGGKDGADQIIGGDIFEQVALCACLQGGEELFVVNKAGEDDDARLGERGEDLFGGFDAIEMGHDDIHQDHIGLVLEGKLDGFLAIRSFTNDLDLIVEAEEGV